MLRETLAGIPPDANLTVLTHSRGCTLWFHHAAAAAMDNFSGPQAARVLLVAPPYRVHENDPSGFYPAPLNPVGLAAAGRNTAIIASDDDEFTTYEEAAAYAAALSIPIFKLSGAGHISPMFGYGNWPWILNWCLGSADLPPEPKS
jgi:predicted alpha/beta hydrolase family esterase